MIVIDWVPNSQGGFFANVLLDENTQERWIWNGKDDCYDILEAPDETPALPEYPEGSVGEALLKSAMERK